MENEQDDVLGVQITSEHRKALRAILDNMEKIKMDNEALKEDKKALADQMNVKPAIINKITSIMKKEQEEGGVLRQERNTLDLIEQVLEQSED